MLHNPYLPKRKKREPIRPTKPPAGAAPTTSESIEPKVENEPVATESSPASTEKETPPPRRNARQRAHDVLGPAPETRPTEDAAEGAADELDADAIDANYERPADAFAAQSIDGDYETPAKALPFRALRRGLDLHCYTGRRFTKKQFDADGDIIFFNKEEILARALRFIRTHGEAGVKLGSARDKDLPDPDSLEAWLRKHAFALQGRLASYFPPILERLGAITLVTKQRALYAVATGRVTKDVAEPADADTAAAATDPSPDGDGDPAPDTGHA